MAYRIKIVFPDGSMKIKSSTASEGTMDALLRFRTEYPNASVYSMDQPDRTPPAKTAFDLKPEFRFRRPT